MEPVEIIGIGFLQVISALLEKISKIWIMVGKWDKDGEKQNNFSPVAVSFL